MNRTETSCQLGDNIVTASENWTNYTLILKKYDVSGNILFAKQYDFGFSQKVYLGNIIRNGAYFYVCGTLDSAYYTKGFILKIDTTNFNVVYSKSYGIVNCNQTIRNLTANSFGDILLVGTLSDNVIFKRFIYVVKLNGANGNLIYQKAITTLTVTNQDNEGYSVAENPITNKIFVGGMAGNKGTVIVLSNDNIGNVLQIKEYKDISISWPENIIIKDFYFYGSNVCLIGSQYNGWCILLRTDTNFVSSPTYQYYTTFLYFNQNTAGGKNIISGMKYIIGTNTGELALMQFDSGYNYLKTNTYNFVPILGGSSYTGIDLCVVSNKSYLLTNQSYLSLSDSYFQSLDTALNAQCNTNPVSLPTGTLSLQQSVPSYTVNNYSQILNETVIRTPSTFSVSGNCVATGIKEENLIDKPLLIKITGGYLIKSKGTFSYEIFDLNGRKIYKTENKVNEEFISLEPFSNGIYLLKIIETQESEQYFRIINVKE